MRSRRIRAAFKLEWKIWKRKASALKRAPRKLWNRISAQWVKRRCNLNGMLYGSEALVEFRRIKIPMVRRVYPQLIAHQIIGVQPLLGPTGGTYFKRFHGLGLYKAPAREYKRLKTRLRATQDCTVAYACGVLLGLALMPWVSIAARLSIGFCAAMCFMLFCADRVVCWQINRRLAVLTAEMVAKELEGD